MRVGFIGLTTTLSPTAKLRAPQTISWGSPVPLA